jgi:hypothetical protein
LAKENTNGSIRQEGAKQGQEGGRSGKKVTSRKQAIAIGLSEARKAGAKVPRRKSSSKKKVAERALLARKSQQRVSPLLEFAMSSAAGLGCAALAAHPGAP